MPTYKVTDPRTGNIIRLTGESPPTEQEIVEVLSNLNKAGNSSPSQVSGSRSSGQEDPTPGMGGVEKFLTGVGKGMTDVGMGVMQKALQVGNAISPSFVPKESLDAIESDISENRRVFKPLADRSTVASVGEFIGNAAPTAIIPGGVAGGVLRRLGTSALSGAAVGAVQPTTKDESSALNAITGAAGGAVGSGVLSGAGKAFNAIAGKAEANATEGLAKRYGIRTTLGEATGNPITQKIESWLESVPLVGLKGFRDAQNKEAESASKKFLSKYIVDPNAPDTMQTNRGFTSALYGNLKSKVAGIQDQSIVPEETRRAASELLERYPDIFKKFQDTQREGIIKNVIGDTKPNKKSVNVMDDQFTGTVDITTPKTLTFDEIWTLRDGLGSMIGQARKKLAAGDVDKTTYGEISKLYGAVNDDIDKWATSIGRKDIRTAINDANDAYKQYIVKYDIIQRAYDKAAGEAGASEIFSPKKFSTALKSVAYKDKQLQKFSAQEISEMTGLANIMQTVKRAGQYKENPPTGNRWGLPVVAAGSMALSPEMAGAEIGAVALARFLTGTEAGKKLAMAASKIEPGSKAMGSLVNIIYNQIPKMTAIELTSD